MWWSLLIKATVGWSAVAARDPREMGRRKAVASRKARTRIAPLTANGTVQEITAAGSGRRKRAPAAGDRQTGELLRVLGLADRLNKPIAPVRKRPA